MNTSSAGQPEHLGMGIDFAIRRDISGVTWFGKKLHTRFVTCYSFVRVEHSALAAYGEVAPHPSK